MLRVENSLREDFARLGIRYYVVWYAIYNEFSNKTLRV